MDKFDIENFIDEFSESEDIYISYTDGDEEEYFYEVEDEDKTRKEIHEELKKMGATEEDLKYADEYIGDFADWSYWH